MNSLSILECPVCGGSLNKLSETAYKCKYCGNVLEQKPSLPDDVTHNLLSAVQLRRAYEFAKAGDAYAAVLENHRDVCEANWGAFLCRYGVNYVLGQNGKFQPTFWRVDTCSTDNNSDYKTALALCGEDSRDNYRERGQEIEALRMATVNRMKKGCDKEIYLCARQMPDDGGRDTAAEEKRLCDEVYAYLTEYGYRVFYEPKSLNEIDSFSAEPEIFAAINACRFMLVPECGNGESKWVKDKYMRFKALAQAGSGKGIGVITSSGLISSSFLAGCTAYNSGTDGWREQLLDSAKKLIGIRKSEHEKAERNNQKEAEQKQPAEKEKRKKEESEHAKNDGAATVNKFSVNAEVASTGFGKSAFAPPPSKSTAGSGTAFKGAKAGDGPTVGRISDGAIQTDPKALREIAQMIRSYCTAQGRISEGYTNGIKSLTHDWDDEGYRQLLEAVTGIRGKLSLQLTNMESFARWLEQKADILDHMPK